MFSVTQDRNFVQCYTGQELCSVLHRTGAGTGTMSRNFRPLIWTKTSCWNPYIQAFFFISRRYSRNLRVRVVIDTLKQCQRSRCFRFTRHQHSCWLRWHSVRVKEIIYKTILASKSGAYRRVGWIHGGKNATKILWHCHYKWQDLKHIKLSNNRIVQIFKLGDILEDLESVWNPLRTYFI